MGGMFLPFFALSFLRVIIAGEMRIGFDMYSMLPCFGVLLPRERRIHDLR
jgi:hypothetical protein